MTIWSSELKDLEKLQRTTRKEHPKLEKELLKLIHTDDENMALVYARRCLEIVITEICERELGRSRGTGPLKGIIDKLNREEKVPSHIIASMNNINSLSTFGAHPKDFDPEQVKPVLLSLTTTLRWYLKYSESHANPETSGRTENQKNTEVTENDDGGKPFDGKDAQHGKSGARIPVLQGVAIAVLLVVAGFLLYPRIFKTDQLKELRDDLGMISVAVLPFENLSGDSSLDYWQKGISEYLINGLGNSDELAVSSSQVISDVLAGTRGVNQASLTPEIARKTAGKINASTYITGKLIGEENNASILLNLVNTASGDLIWSTQVEGNLGSNYRAVLKKLSDTVKNHMEIQALEDQAESDLSDAYPNSAEAYRYYIDGLNALLDEQYDNSIESLKEAYRIDSTFTFASFYLAFAHNLDNNFGKDMVKWVNRAHELKDHLPPVYRPWIDLWYACFVTVDREAIEKYCDRMFEAAVHSRLLLFDLGITYQSFLGDLKKSIRCYQRIEALNEQWNDDWRFQRYYFEYGRVLLKSGKPDEARRIVEKGIEHDPDDGYLRVLLGASYIMTGDTLALNKSKKELRESIVERGYGESYEELAIGFMYMYAQDSLGAIPHLRRSNELDPEKRRGRTGLMRCMATTGTDLDKCILLARKAAKDSPSNSWGYKWMEAECLVKLGKYKEAHDLLMEVNEELVYPSLGFKESLERVERILAMQ